MGKWIGDRISTEDHEKSTTIVILPVRNKVKEALLFAWILGFTFVGLSFVYILATGVELLNSPDDMTQEDFEQQKIYLIIVIAFWIYFEYKTVKAWLWYRFGKELLMIDTEALSIKKSMFGYGKARQYYFENIKNFGDRPIENTRFGHFFENAYWTLGMDRIIFDYFGKGYSFGRRLDDKDTKLLIRFIDDRIKKMIKKRKSFNS